MKNIIKVLVVPAFALLLFGCNLAGGKWHHSHNDERKFEADYTICQIKADREVPPVILSEDISYLKRTRYELELDRIRRNIFTACLRKKGYYWEEE